MATISNGNNLIPQTATTGFGGFPSPLGAGIGGGMWGSNGLSGFGFGGMTGMSALNGAAQNSNSLNSIDNKQMQQDTQIQQQMMQQEMQMQQVMMQMLQMMMQSMSGLGGSSAGAGGVSSPFSGGSSAGGGGGSSPVSSGSGGGGTGASSGTGGGSSYDGASTGSSSGVNSGAAANAKIVAQVAQSMGVDPVTAVATMLVESGGNNDAVGDNGTSYGLFQLHKGGELGNLSQSQAENAATNAKVALGVFAQNKGKYSDPGQLAAASQRPADPQAYAQKVDAEIPEAKKLLAQS